MHVYLMPLLILEELSVLHEVPLLTDPEALTGTNKNDAEMAKVMIFFMDRVYFHFPWLPGIFQTKYLG